MDRANKKGPLCAQMTGRVTEHNVKNTDTGSQCIVVCTKRVVGGCRHRKPVDTLTMERHTKGWTCNLRQ